MAGAVEAKGFDRHEFAAILSAKEASRWASHSAFVSRIVGRSKDNFVDTKLWEGMA